ncbi:MAG: hypothetical protein IKF39_01905 [Oscillospiraceae bacterium]|nr:hypothetical protein [Oscillospiraceae bacterium]
MKVRNMESPRSGRAVANQYIITDGERVAFQSYESMIAEIDYSGAVITIGEDWNYSNTTTKYRNAFFDEMYIYEMNSTEKVRKALKAGAVSINGYKFAIVRA